MGYKKIGHKSGTNNQQLLEDAMKRPYTIKERKWELNGKKKASYLYTLNESSGLPSHICQKHQRKTIHAKNRNEANMKVLELIREIEKSLGTSESQDSFGHYTSNYMVNGLCHYQSYVRSEGRDLSPSYMKEYRSIFERYVQSDEILSSLQIAGINRGDLIRYRERLVNRIGVCSTGRKAFKTVKQNLKYAAMMGDIPHDPSAGMADIKDKPQERGILTMDEIRKIFPQDGLGPWKDDQDYLAFYLAYSCGLRKGETLGIRWKNVDLVKKVIFIQEALIDIEHKMGDPKKGKKRWCPLPKSTTEKLKAWKDKSRCSSPEDFVFCYQKRYRGNFTGEHFSGSWWRSRFKGAMNRAGIKWEDRNIVPHSLRHSLNTHLQDRGYSRDKIRDTLGWSSLDVQMIYTHSDMMDHSGQADIIEKILIEN